MTIQLIELRDSGETEPSVKLAATAQGSIWQYMGCLAGLGLSPGQRIEQDLNRAAENAAQALLKKVSSRNVHVELIIDPLIPPLGIDNARVLPIVLAIAENASASVEPGPATVTLSTWWHEKYVGVDAVGRGGKLPFEIRENLTRPGFTTRVAEWDTGFGLHAAMEAASAIAARIELFEPDGAIGFRLAIPLKHGTPLSPPGAETGLRGVDQEAPVGALAGEGSDQRYTLLTSWRGLSDVESGIIEA